MPELSTRLDLRTVNNIALAYFMRPENLHDAVRDLCTANFQARDINISGFAAPGGPAAGTENYLPLPNAIGMHSLRWSWKQSRVHDRYRRGADQINGRNPIPAEGQNPTCSTLDLPVALGALSVSREIIWLLEQDARKGAAFVLVDAKDRVDEAGTILSGNAGYVRTDYLTGSDL